MVTYFEATLSQLAIHKTGNKLADEPLTLSEQPVLIIDDTLKALLMQYFLTAFEKQQEVYHFAHPTDDLNLNEVYHFASKVFDDPESFHENSKQITRHLYDISTHPKIKAGEVYIVLFDKLQIEGELLPAIGIFKSESKEPYLTVKQEQKEFELDYTEEAINIKKLDKGCIIFNADKENGYKVVVVDQTNRNTDAVYWTDDFLKLKIRNDNFTQTHTTLSIYKNFVTGKMDEAFEISKADKIDLLNRSIQYFKEKDNFNIDEFGNEVIGNEEGIALFKTFKREYEEEYEMPVADSFEISNAAVKKQSRVYKSVLKLDRNFHIYIHGNKEMIEKGFDAERGMNYYKVYFKEEQ